MFRDKPIFTVIRVTGNAKDIVAKVLGIKANDGIIMPAHMITKSEHRFLFVLGSKPLAASITDVDEDEMARTCWIHEDEVTLFTQEAKP